MTLKQDVIVNCLHGVSCLSITMIQKEKETCKAVPPINIFKSAYSLSSFLLQIHNLTTTIMVENVPDRPEMFRLQCVCSNTNVS